MSADIDEELFTDSDERLCCSIMMQDDLRVRRVRLIADYVVCSVCVAYPEADAIAGVEGFGDEHIELPGSGLEPIS